MSIAQSAILCARQSRCHPNSHAPALLTSLAGAQKSDKALAEVK
jgi:hypothetical protein